VLSLKICQEKSQLGHKFCTGAGAHRVCLEATSWENLLQWFIQEDSNET
jgi:hypothetical protein